MEVVCLWNHAELNSPKATNGRWKEGTHFILFWEILKRVAW